MDSSKYLEMFSFLLTHDNYQEKEFPHTGNRKSKDHGKKDSYLCDNWYSLKGGMEEEIRQMKDWQNCREP